MLLLCCCLCIDKLFLKKGMNVMKYTNKELILAHKFSVNNRPHLLKDSKCGCFYCKNIFSPSEFTDDDWMFCPGEEQGTAICPYCMIDSIISESSGYPITQDFIDAMYEFWFGPEGVDYDKEKEAELCEITGQSYSEEDRTIELSFTPEAYEKWMKALE